MLSDLSMSVSAHSERAPNPGARLVDPTGRVLPLRQSHLDAEAVGGLCRVVLTQTFTNPYDEPLCVTYHLPLPADGAVSGFSFTLGETRVEGELKRRAAARKAFETAISNGQTAALLEEDTSALFTQEVGNVPPHETIVVEILVDQPLHWSEAGSKHDAGWEWRFPTVVGPRYFGGEGQPAPSHTLDVSTVDTAAFGKDNTARSSLSLRVLDTCTGDAASSSHRIRCTDDEIHFTDARLDRDIVVRWPVGTPDVGASLSVARIATSEGAETVGVLTLVPPTGPSTPVPRDVILLLDTSGSMSGEPLAQLKRMTLALIDSLGAEDRLEMIEFSNRPSRFQREPIATSKSGKRSASKWVRGLKASGGTEMLRGVHEALRPLRDEAQRQVVLITDGFIGNEDQLVKPLLDGLPSGSRLHVVGVGAAPNRALTRTAARAGRGSELFLDHGQDVEPVVEKLIARTAHPVVTDLVIDGDAVLDVAPRILPDLHSATPVRVGLRLGTGSVRVRGRTADGVFEETLVVGDLALGEGVEALSTYFARERVTDLEMERCCAQDKKRFDTEIEEVALRHRIASRLTSWVAVTEKITVEKGPKRHEQQPHLLPAGMSIAGLGLREAASGARTQTGTIKGGVTLESLLAAQAKLSGRAVMHESSDANDAFGEMDDVDEEMATSALIPTRELMVMEEARQEEAPAEQRGEAKAEFAKGKRAGAKRRSRADVASTTTSNAPAKEAAPSPGAPSPMSPAMDRRMTGTGRCRPVWPRVVFWTLVLLSIAALIYWFSSRPAAPPSDTGTDAPTEQVQGAPTTR